MNPGAQNVPMGGDAFGTEIPRTQVDDSQLAEMVKTAKFSKTTEFKELKRYLLGRKDFYEKYLPGGKPVLGTENPKTLGSMWIAANAIIGEIDALIAVYENAAEMVKEAKKNAIT